MNINNDLLQSRTIDWLRFPLAAAVVFIHSFGSSEYELPRIDSFSGMDVYNLIRICFSHVITHVAVPLFFLISGYLFFCKIDDFKNVSIWKEKFSSRFRTLVIPYLLWNLIAILSSVGLKLGAFIVKGKPLSNIYDYFQENGWLRLFWDCNVWGAEQQNWLGMSIPHTGPVDLPLWFLRDLIIVVLFTPLIYWLLKHLRHYLLWILAFCYVSRIWPVMPGMSISAFLFFSVGAYFSIYGKNLVCEFQKIRLLSYIMSSVLLMVTIWFDGSSTSIGILIYPFFVIMGVCATFNLGADLLRSGKVKVYPLLSKSSFFIFSVHTILILRVSGSVCTKLLNGTHPAMLTVRYFLIPILTVAICLTLYWGMKRVVPKVLAVLTGDR